MSIHINELIISMNNYDHTSIDNIKKYILPMSRSTLPFNAMGIPPYYDRKL